MPPVLEVPVGARVRGRRGLKIAAWLLSRLRVETRVGKKGEWQSMPIDVTLVVKEHR